MIQYTNMNSSHSVTNSESDLSPSVQLGRSIRRARKLQGDTIAQLAEKIGRPREWLNRVELGHSERGEHRPPSGADLEALIECLGKTLDVSPSVISDLGQQAESAFNKLKRRTHKQSRNSSGKLTNAEVLVGGTQLANASIDLINEQHSDAIFRNTGIWSLAPGYLSATPEWKNYRKAMGRFLKDNPHSVLKRAEYVGSPEHLKMAEETDRWNAGGRKIEKVHNVKLKYFVRNPLLMDVLIGQREAILVLPQNTANPRLSIALLVRDKLFVESLRSWFDEVLWDYPATSQTVDYQNYEESFSKIRKMYNFKN